MTRLPSQISVTPDYADYGDSLQDRADLPTMSPSASIGSSPCFSRPATIASAAALAPRRRVAPAVKSQVNCHRNACIAAKFDLRINHTSFHRPLPLSRCEVVRPDTGHSRPVRKQQPKHGHIIFAATRSLITPRDDDRELQTEQTIVGLPPRKLQPPAWSATAARSVFGASRQLPDRLGERPLTESRADTRACRWEMVKMPRSGPLRQPRGLPGSMASRPSLPVELLDNREAPPSAETLRYARDQLVCP